MQYAHINNTHNMQYAHINNTHNMIVKQLVVSL